MRPRHVFAFASAGVVLATIAIACSDPSNETIVPAGDASSKNDDADIDPGEEEDDASTSTDGGPKPDAKADAKAPRDANGTGEAGDDCVLNYDCQLALRCYCDGTCSCEPGARGTGQNGITVCDAGEQCASSLCVEGPGDSGVHYCSDECESNADCTGMLPTCKFVSLIGDICVRASN